MGNGVTVTEAQDPGVYFWTNRVEVDLIFDPTSAGSNFQMPSMLQRRANGNVVRCDTIKGWVDKDDATKIKARWDNLKKASQWNVGDTVEQVEACCPHYCCPLFEPACCRGQGRGDCCQGDCGEGEGDCDRDSDCLPGLVCGAYNCEPGTYPAGTLAWNDDCCKKAP